MSKMDLIRQNMAKRQEKTLDAFSDNMLRAQSASIPLKWIRLNPKNVAASEDSDEDVQRLADDIATIGLLHNLVVNQIGENDYMLISGERRYKALTKLGWTHAPCVVYDNLPEAMFGVMTVLANLDAREYSAAKRLQLYTELESYLRNLKEMGMYRGGIGKGIARIIGVSEQQIGKYKKLTAELTPEELANVTNIDAAVKEIAERKTESKFPFSTSGASQEATQPSKNESDFNFFGGIDHEMQSSDSENPTKNESHFNFSDGVDCEMQSNDSGNPAKNESHFNSLPEEPKQNPIETPIAVTPKTRQHPITASELSIDYDGTSYLCAFGKHVNGGWIAILNFGVAAELSDDDATYNTNKIEEAFLRSDDPWLPTGDGLTNAARHIAEIVTERIGG